jgi:hypothetical protein
MRKSHHDLDDKFTLRSKDMRKSDKESEELLALAHCLLFVACVCVHIYTYSHHH